MFRLISVSLLGLMFMSVNLVAVCHPCEEQWAACTRAKGQHQSCKDDWAKCYTKYNCPQCTKCDDPYKECLRKYSNNFSYCRPIVETCYITNNCSQCKPCERKYVECRNAKHSDGFCVTDAQTCYYQNKCTIPFYLK